MTKEELIIELNELADTEENLETARREADHLLLRYLWEPEITKAFMAVKRWYPPPYDKF